MIDREFDTIDIDREVEFNDVEINRILHGLIDFKNPYFTDAGIELKPLARVIKFCHYTSDITDEKLLNDAIIYIKNQHLLKNADAEFEKLKQDLDNSYSDIDLIKLKATFYSLDALFEIYIGELNPPNTPPPFPYAKLNGRLVHHNLSSIKKTLRNKSNFELKESIKIILKNKVVELIDLRLESYRDLDYLHSTKIFTDDIEYLETVKKKLIEKTETTSEPSNPVIETKSNINKFDPQNIFFENGYEYFINYKKHIIEPYVDYSYLFQRMLIEGFVHKIQHLQFAEWLFINNHITQNTKDIVLKNSGFRSLNKSFSDQRCNNFNIVFGL